MIDSAASELRYLRAHRPDFNPIENNFSKLNGLLQKQQIAPSMD
jgi:hypothetical protein